MKIASTASNVKERNMNLIKVCLTYLEFKQTLTEKAASVDIEK